ncbi:MAG: hypothetical protein V4643_04230 [Bacteroidota bacterium]
MLRNLFETKNFLYPDLPPKQRFLKILETHVLPELEKDGFVFIKSGPSLKRKEGRFEWIVEFQASKWNHKNEVCKYNPYFKVTNLDYKEYSKANKYDSYKNGIVGTTAGIQHWNKSSFSTDGSTAYFIEDNDFSKHDNNKLVKEMIQNIRAVGIPYFKMMSDFNSIKQFYLNHEQRIYAPQLIDLCYALNRSDQLKSIFEWYYADNENCADWLEYEMKIRKNSWLQHTFGAMGDDIQK